MPDSIIWLCIRMFPRVSCRQDIDPQMLGLISCIFHSVSYQLNPFFAYSFEKQSLHIGVVSLSRMCCLQSLQFIFPLTPAQVLTVRESYDSYCIRYIVLRTDDCIVHLHIDGSLCHIHRAVFDSFLF